MTPLATRKALLLAESELNRDQLRGELAVWMAEARALRERAEPYAALVSAAAGWAAAPAAAKEPAGTASSWLALILRNRDLLLEIWRLLRGR